MTTIQDLRNASSDDILKEMERLLRDTMGGAREYLPAVGFYQQELTRRMVPDLSRSSRRLEILTRVLIVLTLTLLIVAFPPMVEVVVKLFHM